MVPAPSLVGASKMTFLDYAEIVYYTTSGIVSISLLGYGLYLVIDTLME